MHEDYRNILSPIGVSARDQHTFTVAPTRRRKNVIALLNNSKPNVSYFLEAVEEELQRTGDFDIINVSKARSAAPYPDIADLAARCDYVINAVAD